MNCSIFALITYQISVRIVRFVPLVFNPLNMYVA